MHDLSAINIHGFAQDIEKLRKETFESLSESDFHHLQKIERYGKLSTVVGYLTAWIIPNPLTAFLLSLGQFTRWLLAHHIMHRGYDRVPGIPKRYTSKHFARGYRRYVDWFDWLYPEAWDYEHNILHHYHTCEEHDPDLAERHTKFLRQINLPYFVKYILLILAGLTWKYTYYAPSTLSVLDPADDKRLKKDHIAYITFKNIFHFNNRHVRTLWLKCYIPYFAFNFVLIPLAFLPLGSTAAWFVLINKLMAECITNFHSFFVIAPNHTADDLYRFDFHYENKPEFYVTQVLGSVNYNCGNDFVDYMSIWLNYQIEHHIFPELPMTKYREVQPKVKALCKKHNIAYRQESIFKRFGRMMDVCIGRTSMKELQSLPVARAH